MQILIIEDEKLAADRLERILLEIDPNYQVKAKIGSVSESVKWLKLNNADLIFLDIQLSDGLSFSIFEQIPVHTPVIFTTAYDQYAIKAFEVNSISYLLKPIRKTDLTESLQKYKNMKSAFSIDLDSLIPLLNPQSQVYRKRFLIQTGERIQKIETSEIAYFFALDKNVFLKTFKDRLLPLDLSLDKLEQILNPVQFFRINRKYIVNMESISKMTAWSRGRIKLVLTPAADDENDVTVSIDRSSNFKEWLNQ